MNGRRNQKQVWVAKPKKSAVTDIPKTSTVTINIPTAPRPPPARKTVTKGETRPSWAKGTNGAWIQSGTRPRVRPKKNSGQTSETVLASGVVPTSGLNRTQLAPSTSSGNSSGLIDKCSSNYLRARFDPWANFDRPPCNPVRTPVQSIKVRVRLTGLGQADDGGNAWVVVNPYGCFSNNNCANISRPGFNLALGQLYNVTNGIDYPWSDSPFSLNDGAYKIVGVAIRMCDIGTVLSAAGVITRFNNGGNIAVAAGVSSDVWATPRNAKTNYLQSQCYQNSFVSIKEDDDEVIPYTQSTDHNGATFGLAVTGLEKNRAFNYEIAGWYEFVPDPFTSKLKSLTTESEASSHPQILNQAISTTHQATIAVKDRPVERAHATAHNLILDTAEKIPIIGDAVRDIRRMPLFGTLLEGATGLLSDIGGAFLAAL